MTPTQPPKLLSPKQYLTLGFSLALSKFTLDHATAHFLFSRPWSPINYLIPTDTLDLLTLQGPDRRFLLTMLLISIPFASIGILLTLRRLRDANLPPFIVLLFFVPILNLLLFAILSILPSIPTAHLATDPPPSAGVLPYSPFPDRPFTRFAFAAILPVLLGLGLSWFGIQIIGNYGWGLFVAMPFAVGMASSLLYGIPHPRPLLPCLLVATVSHSLLALGLILIAMEGAGCIIMATPILLPFTLAGAIVGWCIQRRPLNPRWQHAALTLLLLLPPLMGTEPLLLPPAPLYAVRTAVEINAPPSIVWQHVITFGHIPPPSQSDWIFRLGAAYPLHATITGNTVGAIRRCEFSTGSFIEPITTWDAPHLLAFNVTHNPTAMTEWSPYSNIHPPHLSGFLTARHGEFLLIPHNNHTTLVGTTWYQHHLWPASYWRIWSDSIIHHIHTRVLEHIKTESER